MLQFLQNKVSFEIILSHFAQAKMIEDIGLLYNPVPLSDSSNLCMSSPSGGRIDLSQQVHSIRLILNLVFGTIHQYS